MNDRHYGKGSPKGGQFAPKDASTVSEDYDQDEYGRLAEYFRNADKPKLPGFNSYSPQIQKVTNDKLNSAFSKELEIRKDIETITKLLEGEMVGLEHALKSKESLAYKIVDNIQNWGMTEQEAIDSCDDVIRYTIIFNGNEIAEKSNDLFNYIFDKGYKYKYMQNRYIGGKNGYKDLNMKMYDPSGQAFEIQIMTPEMYKAKNEINEEYGISGHDIYDYYKIARINFKGEELKKVNKFLDNLTEKIYGGIEVPKGIEKIDRRLYEKYGKKQ